jgi:trehalose-6-phosphatase
MFELPALLRNIDIQRRSSFVDANNNHPYRAKVQPYQYNPRSFSKADRRVNSVVDRIAHHLKNPQSKILFVFDLDGTLTNTTNPDATLPTQIPENISETLSKLATNPRFEVAILTARNHHSLNQVNLDNAIKKYASNGEIKLNPIGDDKIHIDVIPHYEHIFNEAQEITKAVLTNPEIKSMIDKKDLAFHTGVVNIGLGVRQDCELDKRIDILTRLKEIMSKIIPLSWRYFSEYENNSNLFYCSKEIYGSVAHEKTDYKYKAPGINRISEDLAQEGFHPTMVVCVGDTNADLTMMDEAKSWNQHLKIIENINIAVGDKISRNSKSVTNRFQSPNDVYEMLIHLSNLKPI